MKGTFMGTLSNTRPNAGRVYTCKVATVLDGADTDDLEAVAQAMNDESLSNRKIAVWLGVSENTVVKHRVGVCACNRG